MTLDRIVRPIHPDDGTAFCVDSSTGSFGDESDLSAPYGAWLDSLVSGPLFRVFDAPAPVTGMAPA
jgi:hypothetical protein